MAVENKRMQQRYGTYSQFQTDKVNLLPNEFASVTADDPNTTSGKALYFNSESGEPNRLLTDEDKTALDSAISTASQTANSAQSGVTTLQSNVYNLQTTVSQHTTAINSLNTEMPNKIEQEDLTQYAYSKSESQALINSSLSRYYTANDVDERLSFGFEEIQTSRFAGKPCYSWVRLGFNITSPQRIWGVCLMTIDSPICTGDDTTLSIPLPFSPARTIAVPINVGNQTFLYELEAGADTLDITGISVGDTVSTTFAYRIGIGG